MEMYPFILSHALRERGLDVSLLAFKGSPLSCETKERARVPLFQMSPVKYVDVGAVYSIARLISRLNINVVHVHHASDLWLVVPAVRFFSLSPVLLFTSQMGSVYKKRDPAHRFLYSRLDLAIAITDDSRRKMIQSCPIPPERATTLHYGIDTKRFNPDRYNKDEKRKMFGFKRGETVVGMLGRIDPRKGQKEFILAAREVLRSCPGTKFIIAGSADRDHRRFEEELKNLVQESGMERDVTFKGFVKDTPSFLSCLDLFVMASYEEAFGIVLIEAMAMGIPVIGTRAGGVPEIVEEERSGLLVPPGDEKALAESMKRLIVSRDLANQLARRGKERAEEMFSLDRHVERVAETYDRLLKEKDG